VDVEAERVELAGALQVFQAQDGAPRLLGQALRDPILGLQGAHEPDLDTPVPVIALPRHSQVIARGGAPGGWTPHRLDEAEAKEVAAAEEVGERFQRVIEGDLRIDHVEVQVSAPRPEPAPE